MKNIVQMMAVLLVAGMALSACKTKKVGSDKKVPADFALKLTHTGCRGFCPAYSLEVDAKGAAKYVGSRAVDMLGTYTKTLGQETVTSMAQAITDAHFWEFEAEYGGEVADVPGIFTQVTMDGKTKEVRDIRNAPQALKDLEAQLEKLFDSGEWVKQQ